MRKLILILAGSVMACSLLFIIYFTHAYSKGMAAADLVSPSEQRLQSQIDDLTVKVSTFNTVVSQFQSQTKEEESPITSTTGWQVLSEIDAITADTKNLTIVINSLAKQVTDLQEQLKAANTKNLSTEVDSLRAQVMGLQDKFKASETIIGTTPITVNGLSIVFITNNIKTEVIGSSIPGVAQFAVKIINNTSSVLANIDVTGTITASQSFSEALASGYPQLADAAGLCSYVFFIEQTKRLHFEAFGNAKTSLSIPVGGSITLRPKISVLAAANNQLPDMAFNVALETITFDRVATK